MPALIRTGRTTACCSPREVTSRREHRPRREAEPEVELVSTAVEHVLGMQPETRVDWLQMALMQAGMGKLKAASLYDVIATSAFAPGDPSSRRSLKALVLANLHLFSPKHKRTLQEVVSAWGSHGEREAGGDHQAGTSSRRVPDGGLPLRDATAGTSSGGGSSSSISSTTTRSCSREQRRRHPRRHGKFRRKAKQHSPEPSCSSSRSRKVRKRRKEDS
mmetsp:Transcript_106125/g.342286  ORF Transcript_106125/g.342286 Transcript_106125/m.342286 type:complete len:218 (+) Transcript_106125:123-776(+)